MDGRYSRSERRWLVAIAVIAFAGVNGGFIYGMTMDPGALEAAWRNPISAAFMVEAFVLTLVLAWLLTRWGVSGMSRGWFILLSLIGSIAFALPVVLLARDRARNRRA